MKEGEGAFCIATILLIFSLVVIGGLGYGVYVLQKKEKTIPVGEIQLKVPKILTNPAVTEGTMDKTICVHNYTKSVRPSTSYTSPIKKDMAAKAGVKVQSVVLDHKIALTISGHPTSIDNLQLQTIYDGKRKDLIENYLNRLVCTGRKTLKEVVEMMPNWELIYASLKTQKLGGMNVEPLFNENDFRSDDD